MEDEMRRRGTAIVERDGKILLVRDKHKHRYSLPGGAAKKGEPAIAAAIRELYEECRMNTVCAKRRFDCDHKGTLSHHKVSLLISEDEPQIKANELDDYMWWDTVDDIPRYAHVDEILKKYRKDKETPTG
jgi:ADP-ribose pyrophosphatase YjhB (NUDIX family)